MGLPDSWLCVNMIIQGDRGLPLFLNYEHLNSFLFQNCIFIKYSIIFYIIKVGVK